MTCNGHGSIRTNATFSERVPYEESYLKMFT